MRTTLKRGTAGHVAGNGHGGTPISPLTGVTRYRTKRRGPLRLLGKFFLWLVMVVLVAAGALAGGACPGPMMPLQEVAAGESDA